MGVGKADEMDNVDAGLTMIVEDGNWAEIDDVESADDEDLIITDWTELHRKEMATILPPVRTSLEHSS